MVRFRPARLFLGIALALGGLAVLGFVSWEPARGVVVERVRPGSVGDREGLQPGDVLLSWRRDANPPANPRPAEGTLGSPFDLMAVLIEELPRGELTLKGRRGGLPRSWTLSGEMASASSKELEARPALPRELRALYRQGKEAWSLGQEESGDAFWRQAAVRARKGGRPDLWAWLQARRARAWGSAASWELVDALYGEVIPWLEGTDGRHAAQLLRVWGRTFLWRESWKEAEDRFRQALRIDRRQAKKSLAEAWSLMELGDQASRSRGSKLPDPFYRQALALRQELAPGSAEVAACHHHLGMEAYQRQDYSTAAVHYQIALSRYERLARDSPAVADLSTELGLLHVTLGEYSRAEPWLRRALALSPRQGFDREARNVLIVQALAEVARQKGDLETAAENLSWALRLAETASFRPQVHNILHDLGLLERSAGRLEKAARHLCRALEVREEQRRSRGPAIEERIHPVAEAESRDCIRALVDTGRFEAAFEVVEKGRAQFFLKHLAERPPRLYDLPPALAARRAELAAEADRVRAALARARQEGDEGLPRLRGRIVEIRRELAALRLTARRSAPRFTALHAPEALDLERVRQVLDPGTVLLSYSAGRERTLLFLVRGAGAPGAGLRVASLPLGEKGLREKVRAFLALCQDGRSDERRLRELAAELYRLLVEPAEPWLSASDRLLISPDGPLHTLPFGALVRDGRYLVQWKPIHLAPSATVFAEIRKGRPARVEPRAARVVIFGDPAGPGLELSLPAGRREARSIAALFPRAELYLGARATEGRAKAVAGSADILHFAVHATLEDSLPLGSSLVLSRPRSPRPGVDNGELEAWEILDGFRLKADLVTLSACETALGEEMGGEGLVGLARALQIAGARSILASHWEVSDEVTADLMESFYRHLVSGASKDRALRAAQVERIRSGRDAHPFHWAAFQLLGDWR